MTTSTKTRETVAAKVTDSSPRVEPAEGVFPPTIYRPRPLTIMERLEAWVSRLSTKNHFWHKVCSYIWLPIAYRSGIKMRREQKTGAVTAILPFRRFNRNWYNAMAGAALLANAEVAGGWFIFKTAGSDYTVVCKEMQYKFMRPCFGPASYEMTPRTELDPLIEQGGEFNITLDMNVMQMMKKPGERARRVGKCEITFHVAPKELLRQRKERDKQRERDQRSKS